MKYIVANDALAISEVHAPKKVHAPIGIYSPDEITRLLNVSDPEFVPSAERWVREWLKR